MRLYQITVTADKYPTTYNIEASNWGTALARAAREWQKKFKGSRTETLSVRAVKSTQVIRESGNDKQ